jgi:hypothetical protein
MRSVALSLFWFALALAQPPAAALPLAISGPTKAEPYRLVELVATGDTAERALLWDVTPEEAVDVREMPGGKLVFVGPPGSYRIKLRAIRMKDNVMSVETARHSISIGNPVTIQPPKQSAPPSSFVPSAGGKIDAMQALSAIRFPSERPGYSNACTATVVNPQMKDGRWRVLTAAHCVPGLGQRGTLTTKDRTRTLAVTVAKYDKRSDLAWLLTDEPAEGLYSAELAEDNPAFATSVWHAGYGVDRPESVEGGQVKRGEDRNGRLTFVLPVSQGDSGGGVFRRDNNKLVSVVCCVPTYAPNLETYGGSVRQARRLWPSDGPTGSEFIQPWQPPGLPPGIGEGRIPWPGDCPDGRCPIR